MYGSLYYNRRSSKISWTEYDEEHKRRQFSLKWVPTFYIESHKSDSNEDEDEDDEVQYKSLDGLDLRPIKPSTWKKRKELIKQYKESGKRIFGSDLPAEDLCILEKWSHTLAVVPEIHFGFVDIETEVSNGFPYPDKALERVNLITVYSNRKKKFVVFGLEHDYKNTREDVVYLKCKTEEDLLKRFVKYIEGLGIDILSGWNSSGFDVPYLFNRILRVLDKVDLEFYDKYLNYKDKEQAPKTEQDRWQQEHEKLNWIKRLSPYQQVEKKRIKTKDRFTKELKDSMGYVIHGLTDYDYLLLYQQFQMGQKESYKLDFIGDLELGERKLEYDGTFKDFYTKDWQTFVDYNIQDVNLLVKLDHKLNYITQAITLSYRCHCQFRENFSTVMKMEVAIYNFLQQRGIIMEDDWNADERHGETFPGAYVKDPIPGMYEYILDFDVASLYPSLMRGINISPDVKKFTIYHETHLFDLDPDEKVNIKWTDYWKGQKRVEGKTEECVVSDLVKLVKDNRYSVSSANVAFEDQEKKKGILVEILDMWYGDRTKDKAEMKSQRKQAEKILNNGKDEMFEGAIEMDAVIKDENVKKYITVSEKEQYDEHLRQGGIYDNRQWSCKILLNSLYGTVSTKFCRFYDIDLARSVTMSGQKVIRDNGDMINKFFAEDLYEKKEIKKKFDINEDYDAGESLVYIDTDSLYVTFSNVFKKLNIDGSTKEKIAKCRLFGKIAMQQLDKFNTDFFEESFNAKNMIFWDQELIADRGIFVKRKKYTCHIVEENGVPKDDLLVKGLDVVRSSTPKVFRDKLKESIIKILKGCVEQEFKKYANECYEEFLTLDIKQISLPKSCNNLSKFETDGLHPMKGTPGHMRSAIAYNYFLNQFKLKDLEQIKEGDRFKMVYLEKHPEYPIPAIGFIDKLPKEFGITIDMVDRKKHFELSFIQPMKGILDVIDWRLPNFFDNSVSIASLFRS